MTKKNQPRSGDRQTGLSPLRGLTNWCPVLSLGLTPQAMNLTPLRGWGSPVSGRD